MLKELVQVAVPKEIYDEFKSYGDDYLAKWIQDKDADKVALSILDAKLIAKGTKIGVKFILGESVPNKPNARKVEIFDVHEGTDGRIIMAPKIRFIMETTTKRIN